MSWLYYFVIVELGSFYSLIFFFFFFAIHPFSYLQQNVSVKTNCLLHRLIKLSSH